MMSGCGMNNHTPNQMRFFHFSYEVSIDPTFGKKLELWIPVPRSNEVQTISNLKIQSDGLPFEMKDDTTHGNKYVHFREDSGTIASKTITMTFDVSRKEHGKVSYKNVDPHLYLEAYSTVPVGNIFSSIIRENQLSKNDVRGIYNFVLSGMHYAKPKTVNDVYFREPWLTSNGVYGQKGMKRDDVVALYQKAEREKSNYTFGKGNSVYACDVGVGNCTDYHSYFMSLGRTLGIPVRFHMGFPIPQNSEGDIKGYHCWADFYVAGQGWTPVDISEADKDSTKSDYYFGTVDHNRVEMMVGRDFVLEGYEDKFVNFFIYPLVEVDDKKSTAFTKVFSYKSYDKKKNRNYN